MIGSPLAVALVDVGANLAGTVGQPVDQPKLLEARNLQAMSLAWHIILVCFGVTFPAIVVFTEGLWLRTGDPVYRDLAHRWSKVMLVLFAVGAVSGTVLTFELGILWPEFMATFGDVFGVSFALEGFAFFLEAIFIGIYVYGWDRIPDRLHILTGLPMVVTGVAGAYFVISVNAWMNNPTGFEVVNGQVTDIDPWTTLTNTATWPQLIHMLLAAYMVAGFLMGAVYAWAWLRGDRSRTVRIAFAVPFTLAALAAPVQLVVGDWIARYVAADQPIKLAAQEGLGETTKGAPFTFGGWYEDGEVKGGIEIPYLLSILADHDPDATVEGLNAVPVEDQPPVNTVRLSFQFMVAVGSGLVLLAAWYLLTWWRKRRLPRSKWFYRAAILAGPSAAAALIAGWIVTEVGRQPWVVQGFMRTEEAVTQAQGIWWVFGGTVVLYGSLAVVTFKALKVIARQRGEVTVPYGPRQAPQGPPEVEE